jgi:hypothetical protein
MIPAKSGLMRKIKCIIAAISPINQIYVKIDALVQLFSLKKLEPPRSRLLQLPLQKLSAFLDGEVLNELYLCRNVTWTNATVTKISANLQLFQA